jgi:hypothetical protein
VREKVCERKRKERMRERVCERKRDRGGGRRKENMKNVLMEKTGKECP